VIANRFQISAREKALLIIASIELQCVVKKGLDGEFGEVSEVFISDDVRPL
jgi:hypothetical protein